MTKENTQNKPQRSSGHGVESNDLLAKKVYEDLDEVIANSNGDCWEVADGKPCANCGCDWSNVYYLFGRHRCDICLKHPEDFTI